MSFEVGERITIPSPIDVHTHLREPGGIDKETIASGTRAALIGGYQAVFDMPNNPGGMQTWSASRLHQKRLIAEQTAATNIGFYAGVDLGNPDIDELGKMIGDAAGLKLYFGHTTGTTEEFVLDHARPVIDEWVARGIEYSDSAKPLASPQPPILLHAREGVGEEVAEYVARQNWPVHWCHVSTSTEVAGAVRLTDKYDELFTAGVTAHHLTMTGRDATFKYGWNGARMMPPLSDEDDQDALIQAYNDGYLQILETDHAPHTAEDKLRAEAENPEGHDVVDCTTCFGISGIEFVLPVMISLVQRKKITMERLVDSLHTQPARMLGLDTSGNRAHTVLEVAPYVIGENDRAGKSNNNPYIGWTAWAKILQVEIDGMPRRRYDAYPPPFEARILKAGSEV